MDATSETVQGGRKRLMFIGGVIVGAGMAIFTMALCVTARRADDQAERMYEERKTHE